MNDFVTGFSAVMGALALLTAILWIALPFAVFGIKSRIDRGIKMAEQIATETRTLNVQLFSIQKKLNQCLPELDYDPETQDPDS